MKRCSFYSILSLGGSLLILLNLLVVTASADFTDYTFTEVASSDDSDLSGVGARPVINNNGEIVYSAALNNGTEVIRRFDGTNTTTLVDSATTYTGGIGFSFFQRFDHNDNGQLAFTGLLDGTNERGIFKANVPGSVDTVARASFGYEFDGSHNPRIGNDGTVAFPGGQPNFRSAIWSGVGGETSLNDANAIALSSSCFSPIGGCAFSSTVRLADVDENGNVYFFGNRSPLPAPTTFQAVFAKGNGQTTSGQDIGLGAGDTLGSISDYEILVEGNNTNTSPNLSGMGDIFDVSDNGHVIFKARVPGVPSPTKIFRGDGTETSIEDFEIIAEERDSSLFQTVSAVSINNLGDTVFDADIALPAGGTVDGVFTGTTLADRVVLEGTDQVFGLDISRILSSSNRAINDRGQIVFFADLFGLGVSRSSIILATPTVPEPETLTMFCIAGLAIVMRRWN